MKTQVTICVVFLLCFISCHVTQKSQVKVVQYKTYNFNDDQFIRISTKQNRIKIYNIVIGFGDTAVHFVKDIDIKKDSFNQKGKYISTFKLIDNRQSFKAQDLPPQGENSPKFIQMTLQEFEAIKGAFLRYPNMASKFSFPLDSLKDYLGWYGIPSEFY